MMIQIQIQIIGVVQPAQILVICSTSSKEFAKLERYPSSLTKAMRSLSHQQPAMELTMRHSCSQSICKCRVRKWQRPRDTGISTSQAHAKVIADHGENWGLSKGALLPLLQGPSSIPRLPGRCCAQKSFIYSDIYMWHLRLPAPINLQTCLCCMVSGLPRPSAALGTSSITAHIIHQQHNHGGTSSTSHSTQSMASIIQSTCTRT